MQDIARPLPKAQNDPLASPPSSPPSPLPTKANAAEFTTATQTDTIQTKRVQKKPKTDVVHAL
jgi:hypothetical protein